MTECYTIEERPDERGILVYVIVQHGIDLTSRWTRADAELELHRLEALKAQPVGAELAIAAE